MNAEIICVGTELLLGDILNTNAQFLSRELAGMGFSVYFQTVVGDNADRLLQVVQLAKNRSDLLIFSGGLGPTDDDLTKETVAKAFNDELVLNSKILEELKETFKVRSFGHMTNNNIKQAYVPVNGSFIENENGTAPGIVFNADGKTAVLLPGPPRELEHMFLHKVKPLLLSMQDSVIKSLVLNTFGIGESALEEEVKQLLNGNNPTAALYAKEGEVHIRITAKADDEEKADSMCEEYAKEFEKCIGSFIYGVNSSGLEYEVVQTLTKTKEKVATAESCTGGLLSERITAVSGASAVFECGICSYGTNIKEQLLNIPQKTIERYGVVSENTACAMAEGVAEIANADYGVGITGIAGPGSGTNGEPEGLVYIAVWYKQKVYMKKFLLTGATRQRVRRIATQHALHMLLRISQGVQDGYKEMFSEWQYEE